MKNNMLCSTNTNNSNNLFNLKKSYQNNNDIEGPEVLHFFYVNILQQNKNLAFRFENCEDENNNTNFLNEFENTNTFA